MSLADPNAGKPTEWPELLGQDAAHAKDVIAAFGYNVILVPEVNATRSFKVHAVDVKQSQSEAVAAAAAGGAQVSWQHALTC
jgi:hypothetical protein